MKKFGICLMLLGSALLLNCKQVRKVADFISEPTAREIYEREFANDTTAFAEWNSSFLDSKKDSLEVELPYVETGSFTQNLIRTHSYNLELNKGRIFYAEILTDSIAQRVFLDFYRISNDSTQNLKNIKSNEEGERYLSQSIDETGWYKLIVQPEIDASTNYSLRIYSQPEFGFPVLGRDNTAIQSFWGAVREGGKRSHEGVDIFADRGTPVLAVTEGRISSTRNRGLGGKQVWQRNGLMGSSLYYAHLDSILVKTGQKVQLGDTLGLVGNTGNARTTKPHLHFGIYEGYKGAIDPLPFIQKTEIPVYAEKLPDFEEGRVEVRSSLANLRSQPSIEGTKLGEAKRNEVLTVFGQTDKWVLVQNQDGLKAYIHQSLIQSPKTSG